MPRRAFLVLSLVLLSLLSAGSRAQQPGPVSEAPAATVSATAAATAEGPGAMAPVAAPTAAAPPVPAAAPEPITRPSLVPHSAINGADTAWLMTSTALVLLMTLPGVALFYGGMVRRKNVLATMAAVVASACIVTVLWFAAGYSLAFTPGSAWIGNGSRLGFEGLDYLKEAAKVMVSHLAPAVPESVYATFQLTFAIITAALIVGAVVERMKFSALLLFIAAWLMLVYVPIAHWVWEPGGWLAQYGVLDFAGGAVVHVNAGMSALACALVLGRRKGYGKEPFEPFNLGLTMAGMALLWVGWFGFNAGSAVAADGRAGLALAVTHIAAAAGALGWMMVEWMIRGRPSLLGLSSGAVSGLVAITPAAGFVVPSSALLIGFIAGACCYWGATALKRMLGADDSLDVFGVHGVGGIVGSVLTGVLASPLVSGLHGSLPAQVVGVAAVALYSFAGSLLILLVLRFTLGLRVDAETEHAGLDVGYHRERVR